MTVFCAASVLHVIDKEKNFHRKHNDIFYPLTNLLSRQVYYFHYGNPWGSLLVFFYFKHFIYFLNLNSCRWRISYALWNKDNNPNLNFKKAVHQ